MSNLEWFKLWDETSPKFQWFIAQYFGSRWKLLEVDRTKENRLGMEHILNDIWFFLPDNRFNIIENPAGWSEFLALIEV